MSMSLPRSRSQSRDSDARADTDFELQCLNAFRHHFLASISGFTPNPQLDRLVLQALYQETCVRYIAVAVTAHQLRAPDANSVFAIHMYRQGVRAFRELLSRQDKGSIQAALICSMLGVCFELMQGAYTEARLHLEMGLHVVSSFQASLDHELANAFVQLDVQGSSFIEGRLPRLTRHLAQPAPSSLDSLESAQSQLFRCLSQLWSFLRGAADDARYSDPADLPPLIAAQAQGISLQLQQWGRDFKALLESNPPKDAPVHDHVRALSCHHTAATIQAATALHAEELIYDQFDGEFESIVSLSRTLLHSKLSGPSEGAAFLGLGVVQPLYFTATRCRVRRLRNEAIRLLSEVPESEGVWSGVAMAQVSAVVKSLEEKGLSEEFLEQHRIPETMRVHSTGTDIKPVQRSSEVCCSLLPEGPKGPWQHLLFQVTW
ncbi:hypothetical protein A1O3_06563 [Capronia epimyces CBS 606.96]|uniref:Uncharacterized protein n=1 Tax=Capronia epimyces CBS 606.96 TaxID=1182542 RepID=W9XR88_9EURO|nr:uncharacterized protein A1O3_06563 [Capronia epimyces CBS 606.96]EXJ82748.1 hypothetical protein A1O3_06563 [Capronia epimyces CBS 606.96]